MKKLKIARRRRFFLKNGLFIPIWVLFQCRGEFFPIFSPDPSLFWEGVYTPLNPGPLGSMHGFHNWIICNQGKFRAGSSGESVVRIIVICWHGRNVFDKIAQKARRRRFFLKNNPCIVLAIVKQLLTLSPPHPLNGSIPAAVRQKCTCR